MIGLLAIPLLALPDDASAATWVLEEELKVQVRPPVPVGWVEGRTVSRWVVSWEPGEPSFRAKLCGIDIDPLLGAVTSWPDRTVQSVPELQRPVSFDGQRFEAGPVVETLGVGDDDGDNNPGITVRVAHPRVGEGEVYLRQSALLAWSGQLASDGRIEGTVRYEPEQEMLGASTWWLKVGIRQRSSRTQTSTFVLTPASPGTTCEKLR